jgi:hypothetical protein
MEHLDRLQEVMAWLPARTPVGRSAVWRQFDVPAVAPGTCLAARNSGRFRSRGLEAARSWAAPCAARDALLSSGTAAVRVTLCVTDQRNASQQGGVGLAGRAVGLEPLGRRLPGLGVLAPVGDPLGQAVNRSLS